MRIGKDSCKDENMYMYNMHNRDDRGKDICAYTIDRHRKALNSTPLTLQRVCLAKLPTLYVVLLRWHELREYASKKGIPWPYKHYHTVDEAFEGFVATYTEAGMTTMNEGNDHDLAWLRVQLNIEEDREEDEALHLGFTHLTI